MLIMAIINNSRVPEVFDWDLGHNCSCCCVKATLYHDRYCMASQKKVGSV